MACGDIPGVHTFYYYYYPLDFIFLMIVPGEPLGAGPPNIPCESTFPALVMRRADHYYPRCPCTLPSARRTCRAFSHRCQGVARQEEALHARPGQRAARSDARLSQAFGNRSRARGEGGEVSADVTKRWHGRSGRQGLVRARTHDARRAARDRRRWLVHHDSLTRPALGATPSSVPGEEFPSLPRPDKGELIDGCSDIVSRLISSTHFSISPTRCAFYLSSALLELEKNQGLRMVTTDGHRLSKMEVRAPEVKAAGSMLIPLKGIVEPVTPLRRGRRKARPRRCPRSS